jgi:hypothetical protein
MCPSQQAQQSLRSASVVACQPLQIIHRDANSDPADTMLGSAALARQPIANIGRCVVWFHARYAPTVSPYFDGENLRDNLRRIQGIEVFSIVVAGFVEEPNLGEEKEICTKTFVPTKQGRNSFQEQVSACGTALCASK